MNRVLLALLTLASALIAGSLRAQTTPPSPARSVDIKVLLAKSDSADSALAQALAEEHAAKNAYEMAQGKLKTAQEAAQRANGAFLAAWTAAHPNVTGATPEALPPPPKPTQSVTEKQPPPPVPKPPDIKIVVIGATWCGPCNAMKPDIAAAAAEGVPIRHLDADVDAEGKQLAPAPPYPVSILYIDGQEAQRVTGRLTREALIDWFHRTVKANTP
jgi:thiol-disulfide isomerase/thioredoxin